MCVRVHPIVAFVLLEQLAELVHVQLVQRVQVLRGRLLALLHPNRTSDCGEDTEAREAPCVDQPPGRPEKPLLAHGMDGFSVGHQAKGVLEDATGMEERHGDAHDALQLLLRPAQPRSSGVFHLVEDFVLPKREGWNQVSSADRFSELKVGVCGIC